MPIEPLLAHSLAEAYLYIMVTPCTACGRGPLRGDDARREQTGQAPLSITIETSCASCACRLTLRFLLSQGTGVTADPADTVINAADEPSRIIDLAQWITLFRMISEAAAGQTDKREARRLALEAAGCLDEALKFFDDAENDLPDPSAFFSQASLKSFKDHPDRFARQRLLNLRSKLPSRQVLRAALSAPNPRRWWKVWR